MKVKSQNINTICGIGVAGYNGDQILATSAKINYASGVVTDTLGNVYIADAYNNRVRKIDINTGFIITYAGTGTFGYNGDNILAVNAQLKKPTGICIDKQNNLFITENNGARVRKVSNSGIITTIAGNGIVGYTGDDSLAINAELSNPYAITVDNIGNIYIADIGNHVIRKVNCNTNIITTVAGTGNNGYSGDNGPANLAQLFVPSGIIFDNTGNLYIADLGNNRIRKIDSTTNIITTFAGTGLWTYNGDSILATSTNIWSPWGIALDTANNLYIAEFYGNRIRKINSNTGIMCSVVGIGTAGYSGDNGFATNSQIYNPEGITFDKCGNLYIADKSNIRIRKVWFNTDTLPHAAVAISPNDTVITGTQVTTTASATNHGTITSYQWVKNGANASTNSTYTYTPVNGDSVYCIVTVRACTGRMYIDTTTAIHITVNGDAGITKIANYNTYTYPNPVTDVLHVATTEAQQYVMHNLMGVAILQGAISKNNIIDMKAIPAGLYLLQLTNAEGKREVVRVVKE